MSCLGTGTAETAEHPNQDLLKHPNQAGPAQTPKHLFKFIVQVHLIAKKNVYF